MQEVVQKTALKAVPHRMLQNLLMPTPCLLYVSNSGNTGVRFSSELILLWIRRSAKRRFSKPIRFNYASI